ncbi:MAG: hypothetical protein K2J81_00675 [Treponemataceae bacterium]|nr:hypothetical protein [Treponemataceae bacterium]
MKKKNVKHAISLCMAIPLLALVFSCTSMRETIWYYGHATNFHEYTQKIEKVTFPDGKVADAYLFDKSIEAAAWFATEWYTEGSVVYPVAQAYDKNGGRDAADISPLSYYTIEDLGQLAAYAHEDFGAYGILEDEKGYYVLSISPPIRYRYVDIDAKTAKQHKGELAYKIAYMPKEAYKPVEPFTIPPSKEKTIDPSSIPDSDKQIVPTKATGNGTYYYDKNIAYELQWLAVKIACKGRYDMAYTGDFFTKDPFDHYTTSLIKHLYTKPGVTTEGLDGLFEGICFNYADHAYREMKENWNHYNKLGIMRYWMVGTFANPSDIIAYRIANPGEQPTMTINRRPVIVYTHNRIQAHRNLAGRSATSHAWFWAQSKDGTTYWIDPTWTDNLGRPVYGIVRGNEEITLTPSSDLCMK